MIYTVTLSPALDYLVWLDQFDPGGLNRTNRTAFRAGGKGINVSVVLTRLGYPNICLGFTAGFVGAEIIRMLDEEGIRHDFIRVENGCTRINVKIKADAESEINAYGPQIPEEDLDKLTARIRSLNSGDILILSGNPPANLPADVYSVLMDAAAGRNVRTVLDTSGKNLLSALKKRPHLVKPNKAELEEVFAVKIDSVSGTAAYARKLQERGAENVLVSLGGDGAMLAADDGKIYTCAVPQGEPVDSTGSGDSMTAGFTAGELSGADKAECLRFAVACGSASAYSGGLLQQADLEQIYARTPLAVSFN